MGASCCALRHDQANTSKFTYDPSLSLQLKPTGGRAPPSQLSLDQISSIRNVRYIQQPHGGQIIGLQKSDSALSQEHGSVALTADGSDAQGAGPVNIIKQHDEKITSVEYKLKCPIVSEEPLTNDSFSPVSNDKVQETQTDDSLPPITNDENFCPTCLDGYDEDNPKIITHCKHHYHLSCILEWMERSKTCAICDQEMVFDETN